jgi:uncharacterized protein (AIM24 family)
MNAPGQMSYTCRYCRQLSDPNAPTCPLCGAPVDIRASVSMSGWQKQPPVRDMARIQFGQSRCQIEGTLVPVADFALAQGDHIYFSHHNLLWADATAELTNMKLSGAWNRMRAGLPLIMVEGRGPGHIALSDNHAGDLVVLPLAHNQQIWVREHRFLAATGNVTYTWEQVPVWYVTGTGDERETHYPMGMYGDIFTAQQAPGLLMLHSPGNTFVRDLRPGERMLVQPSALLYRDLSVTMHLHIEYPNTPGFFWRRSYNYRSLWLRLIGPGRVAVQSVYQRPEESSAISSHSYATITRW